MSGRERFSSFIRRSFSPTHSQQLTDETVPRGRFFGRIEPPKMEATFERIDELSLVALNLWPRHSLADIKGVLTKYIRGEETSVFLHLKDGKCVGLALVSLRHDYVEGCVSSPVGYLEGICVDEKYRKAGIASALCAECEEWAKRKGCSEFASDCEFDNDASCRFHLNVGFEETNRIIHFKKNI